VSSTDTAVLQPAEDQQRAATSKWQGLEQSVVLLIAAGVAAAVNGVFSLLFLRLAGVENYATAAPLLTIGSVAATASVGIEYIATVQLARTKSLHQAQRLLLILLVGGLPLFALTPVLMAVLHIHSALAVALAIALAVTSFAQAVPNAILLAYGRLWSLGIVATLSAVVRIVAFVPFAHHQPVTAAMGVSLAVTVLGGAVMMLIGVTRGNARPEVVAVDAPSSPSQWSAKTLVALFLLLPFVAPVWLAKSQLASGDVARLSVAAFICSSALALVGPITSSSIPHVVNRDATAVLRRARRLTVALAVVIGGLGVAVGPVLVTHVFSHHVDNLTSVVGPMALAVPGWALANYGVWVGLAHGHRARRYLAALVLGVAVQCSVGVMWHTVWVLALGPLMALVVSGGVVRATRWKTRPAARAVGVAS